jgi:hypothetical protein
MNSDFLNNLKELNYSMGRKILKFFMNTMMGLFLNVSFFITKIWLRFSKKNSGFGFGSSAFYEEFTITSATHHNQKITLNEKQKNALYDFLIKGCDVVSHGLENKTIIHYDYQDLEYTYIIRSEMLIHKKTGLLLYAVLSTRDSKSGINVTESIHKLIGPKKDLQFHPEDLRFIIPEITTGSRLTYEYLGSFDSEKNDHLYEYYYK